MSKATNEARVRTLAIVSIGACFVLWAFLFIQRSSVIGIDGERYFALFDDTMISMRYAWNFSHGFGLVWNPGEYVEGYTNPLMVLVMSLPTLMLDKSSAVLAIQGLGAVLMLANAYLVMLIASYFVSERERYRGLFLVLAFLCTLPYYHLLYWSLRKWRPACWRFSFPSASCMRSGTSGTASWHRLTEERAGTHG